MGELSFSCEIDCDKDKFFHVLTDFQNLTDYMPRQLQKISIIEEKNDYTIIESTIFLRSIIKKEFLIPVKLHINSENKIILEILDGVAKGTQSTISFEKDGQKNIWNINTNVKLKENIMTIFP